MAGARGPLGEGDVSIASKCPLSGACLPVSAREGTPARDKGLESQSRSAHRIEPLDGAADLRNGRPRPLPWKVEMGSGRFWGGGNPSSPPCRFQEAKCPSCQACGCEGPSLGLSPRLRSLSLLPGGMGTTALLPQRNRDLASSVRTQCGGCSLPVPALTQKGGGGELQPAGVRAGLGYGLGEVGAGWPSCCPIAA